MTVSSRDMLAVLPEKKAIQLLNYCARQNIGTTKQIHVKENGVDKIALFKHCDLLVLKLDILERIRTTEFLPHKSRWLKTWQENIESINLLIDHKSEQTLKSN